MKISKKSRFCKTKFEPVNISTEIRKDFKASKSQDFELTGSITDIRTFFNASSNKSFALITNGSNIAKLPISIEDVSTEETATKEGNDHSISNNLEVFDTVASSYRYVK